MTPVNPKPETACTQRIAEHYRRASDELLHAYQRNKEAVRHHEAGAFKAALHHAKLSMHHSFNAHAHLKEVLCICEEMCSMHVPVPAHSTASGGAVLQ